MKYDKQKFEIKDVVPIIFLETKNFCFVKGLGNFDIF